MIQPSFSLRPATPDDCETLVRLRMAFLCEINPPQSPAFQQTLENSVRDYFLRALQSGEFTGWLAEANGEVIGTSGLVLFQRPPSFNNLNGLDAYIMNMWTRPDWRKRGVATALFERLLQHIETLPTQKIFLHATEEGSRLYARYGFIKENDEMQLNLPLKMRPDATASDV